MSCLNGNFPEYQILRAGGWEKQRFVQGASFKV
jgi:hypothetical protein